jgi:toxin YhaV
MLAVNGWTLVAHPLFLDQLDALIEAVEAARARDPKGYKSSPKAKLLAMLRTIVLDRIPQDPTSSRYRQGSTLGADYKHWFRDKFGGGRFRLFFRFDTKTRLIIYAWVNDENSLRTYGSSSDAYAVFASMLAGGNPPNDWASLLASSTTPAAVSRLGNFANT